MVHAVELRDRLVRLIHEEQIVLRHVVQQRGRRLAGQPAGEVSRIVFDAMAVADRADHLDVKQGALREALRLDVLPLLLDFGFPPVQLFENRTDGPLLLLGGHHVV